MPKGFLGHLLTAGLLSSSLVSVGFADQILFERDLPSTNINGASGPGRSNYAPVVTGTIFSPGETQVPFIIGDDFSLAGAGSYVVNSLTVYAVMGTPGDSFANEISGMTLYGGADSGVLANLSSSFTTARVQYNGTTDYQGIGSNPPTFYRIYAITFTNLNWLVQGGVDYDFALGSTLIGNNTLALSASTMGTSGGIQNTNPAVGGSDGSYIFFIGAAPPYNMSNSNLPAAFALCDCTPAQDINVVISGSAVPEPSTFALIGLGGLVTIALRRRNKA